MRRNTAALQSQLKHPKGLEAENAKLKRMCAQLALANTAIGAKAVAPSATREVARNMAGEHQGSILRACQAARLSRAAYYKPRVDQSERDRDVVDALNEIVAVELRWEFWKCFDRLRAMGRSPKTRFIGAHSRGLCDALKRAYGGRQSHSNQWVICSVSSLWCTLTTG